MMNVNNAIKGTPRHPGPHTHPYIFIIQIYQNENGTMIAYLSPAIDKTGLYNLDYKRLSDLAYDYMFSIPKNKLQEMFNEDQTNV
jgi:hypothetical protein